MKSLSLACIVLFVSLTFFSMSVSAATLKERAYNAGAYILHFLKPIIAHSLEWGMVIVSILLCIKASPRVIQGVFMQMHKNIDSAAVFIYTAVATVFVSLPVLIARRKNETFRTWLPKMHRHFLAVVQGLVSVTALFIWEERREVSKVQKGTQSTYASWRWAVYLAVFAGLTSASIYLFEVLSMKISSRYFIPVSIFNMSVLAFLILKFDKNWTLSVHEAFKNEHDDLKVIYNATSSYAGSIKKQVDETVTGLGNQIGDLYNSITASKGIPAKLKQKEDPAKLKQEQDAAKLKQEQDAAKLKQEAEESAAKLEQEAEESAAKLEQKEDPAKLEQKEDPAKPEQKEDPAKPEQEAEESAAKKREAAVAAAKKRFAEAAAAKRRAAEEAAKTQ